MANPPPAFLLDILDPVLDYLSDHLPSPLYFLLVKLSSHFIAGLSALFQLSHSLLTNAPEDWSVQAVLPPIITLLAAYMAISSFYRTTTWLLRIIFWFMKWTVLLGVFFGGVGYLLGNDNLNGVQNQGGLGGLFNTLLQDPRQRGPHQPATSGDRKLNVKRPKSWESFEHHKDWQQQRHDEKDGNKQVEDIISQIADTAGNILGGGWWGAVKNIVGNAVAEPNEEDSRTKYSRARKGIHQFNR